MKWSGASIAHFATEAGWPRSSLACITAVALATSGGHDNYDAQLGVPGSGRWKGLWGVDIDRHLEYADLELYDPRVAAAVAYHLSAVLKSLRWAPGFCTRQWMCHYDHAQVQLSYSPFQEHEHDPITVVAHQMLGTGNPDRLRGPTSG